MDIDFKKKLKLAYNFLTHEQEILYFAASLSFYTIFAIIPLCLIIISVISSLPSFQLQIQQLKDLILSYIVPTNTETFMQIFNTFLINTHKMGIVGLIYVIMTSLLFFRNYEFITSRMFNSKPRKFIDSLMVYWVMMTFFPIVIAALFYFNAKVTPILQNTFQFFLLGKIFPWMVVCMLFFVLFKISANKTLQNKILILSSIACASIWYAFKTLFFFYINYNKTYPSLYGSISMLLILMLWIYLSWIILLFGMRVCKGISLMIRQKNTVNKKGATLR